MRHQRLGVVIVVAAALLAGCGSSSPGAVSEGSTTSTAPATTTSAAVPPCGVVSVDLVSQALGEPATFLGTDESGCGFSAGTWYLGVGAVAHDPSTQGIAQTTPTLAGVSVPHSAFLNNDRSGQWQVHASLVVNDVLYTIWLRNDARGSDTYPDESGPLQRPRTAAAAASLLNSVAQAAGAPAAASTSVSP